MTLTVQTVRRWFVAAKRGEARQCILECAVALVQENGAEAMSIEAVAASAGSAKGLVHYHFKTKQGLLSAVAERLASSRLDHWRSAFDAPSAQDALNQTWLLLTTESSDGTVRAWQSLVGAADRLVDGLASKLRTDFADGLRDAFTSMLRDELGLIPTIPDAEIGMLLEALVAGMGFQLTSGTAKNQLDGAYSAAWLAMLSLTQPAP
jgi:AcrR family transcriptional regulator